MDADTTGTDRDPTRPPSSSGWRQRLRASVAIGGFLVVVLLAWRMLAAAPEDARWLRGAMILWAVIVPYWWFVEARFLVDRDADTGAREEFDRFQRISGAVWLGVLLALGFTFVGLAG